jgi:hypothetical protein
VCFSDVERVAIGVVEADHRGHGGPPQHLIEGDASAAYGGVLFLKVLGGKAQLRFTSTIRCGDGAWDVVTAA